MTLDLAIGEPPQHAPWFSIGETGTVVRTAQTRLLLQVSLGPPGGLLPTAIKLPIYLELAFAEAKLKQLACPTGRPESLRVTVSARPGVADLRIAEIAKNGLADFSSRPRWSAAKLVEAPLVSVTGQAHAEVANVLPTDLVFTARDIAGAEAKTVSTRDFTQSLVASLLGELELDIKVAGLGIGLPATVKTTLVTALKAATPAIDKLLDSLLTTLGVHVGEADVRVYGATCKRSVLVQ